MTITLNLPPEAEALLREKASRQDSDAETVATEIVLEVLEREQRDLADAVAGIQRGLDDFEQGRSRPFSEFVAEQRARHHLPADV
jgi:predicted transcriptional regulator